MNSGFQIADWGEMWVTSMEREKTFKHSQISKWQTDFIFQRLRKQQVYQFTFIRKKKNIWNCFSLTNQLVLEKFQEDFLDLGLKPVKCLWLKANALMSIIRAITVVCFVAGRKQTLSTLVLSLALLCSHLSPFSEASLEILFGDMMWGGNKSQALVFLSVEWCGTRLRWILSV